MTLKQRQRHIGRLIDRYRKLLGLERWDLVVLFVDKGPEAACNADDEYLYARLYFNLSKLREDETERIVRHELLHCVLWEVVRVAEGLSRSKRDEEALRVAFERCVTLLERMPVWDKVSQL